MLSKTMIVDVSSKNEYFIPQTSQSLLCERNQHISFNDSIKMDTSIEIYKQPKNDSIKLSESYFLCNVCYVGESDSVFMECKHGGVCLNCAYDIWNTSNECYLCREPIDYILRYDNGDKKGDMFKIIEIHQER